MWVAGRRLIAMGLQELDGMDTPDNKGGRPPKSDEEQSRGREVKGEAFLPSKDDEEWWREKFNRFTEENSNIGDAITQLSDFIMVHPLEVRKRLEDYGIHETDWEEYVEEYSFYMKDLRIHDRLEESGVSTEVSTSGSSSTSSESTLFDDLPSESSSDSESSMSGGLSSLIEE